MKKVISLLVLVSLMCSLFAVFPAANGEPVIQLVPDETTVSPGGEVNIVVGFENNPGIISARLFLNFNEAAFTMTGVDDLKKLGASNHSNKYVSPYILSWENDTASQDFTFCGDAVILTFKVNENAPEGDYDFSLSCREDDILNYNLENVAFTLKSLRVSVAQGGAVNVAYSVSDMAAKSGTLYLYNGGELKYSAQSLNGSFSLNGVQSGSYTVFAKARLGVLTKVADRISVDEFNFTFYSDIPVPVGDVNGDGVIDVGDVSAVLLSSVYATGNENFDVDGNGTVDINDVSTILLQNNYGASAYTEM